VYGASYSRPDDAVLVEVGSFLGRSTILLAARESCAAQGRSIVSTRSTAQAMTSLFRFMSKFLRNKAVGHCVSNLTVTSIEPDSPIGYKFYRGELPMRPWSGAPNGASLILLDGDQSPQGAREAFDAWLPHLKSGGVLIMGNSTPRNYAKTHDGNWLIANSELVIPQFIDPRRVGSATIAIKA
jgi:Methyltransferase domain